MNCTDVAELIPAYALDALDADERAEVEAHLEGCELHGEALEFQRAAARLSAAVPERDPPGALRERILVAAAQSPVTAPLPIGVAAQPPRAVWRRFSVARYALAAALAVLIVGFVSLNALGGSDDETIVRTASNNGITSTLVYVPADGTASISFQGLPSIAVDQAFQLWTIGPGAQPVSAGLLERLQDGTAAATASGGFAQGTTFAVTVEPAGGSEQPTTTALISTDL